MTFAFAKFKRFLPYPVAVNATWLKWQKGKING